MQKGKLRCCLTRHVTSQTYTHSLRTKQYMAQILQQQHVFLAAFAMEQYIVHSNSEDMEMKPVYSDLQVVQVPHDEVSVSKKKINHNVELRANASIATVSCAAGRSTARVQ